VFSCGAGLLLVADGFPAGRGDVSAGADVSDLEANDAPDPILKSIITRETLYQGKD
jgi:hypothetical protein